MANHSSSALFLTLLSLLLCVLGQQQSSGGNTPPPRSYAQAAQNSNHQQQQGVVPAPESPQSAASTPRSYAQAANNNQQRQQGVTPPSQTSTTHRSYAQAANNNRPQQGQTITTYRPTYNRRPTTARPALSPAVANVTDDELRALSEDLLRSDTNNVATNIRANFQARTYGSNQADLAAQPLLSVPPRSLQGTTISKLRALFDNYEADTTVTETVTTAEQNENAALLDAVVATQVMTKTRKFLIDKNLIPNTQGSLRNLLQQVWFTMFPRGGGRSQVGSSSFEHIFLGEVHRGEVSGLHNWVYFANEENSGKVDYRGYIRRIDLGGRGSVVKHNFRWGNVTKPVGSMFIGTSPELEMALYTVCFLSRPNDRCAVRLAGQPFFIKTYPFTYHGKQYIGSAYPDI